MKTIGCVQVVAVMMSLCCGCGTVYPYLSWLPDDLAIVDAQKTEFSQPDNHPILGIPPGTVIDDIANLEGSWAAYTPKITEEAGIGEDLIEHIRFEPSKNRLVYLALVARPWDYGWDGYGDLIIRDIYKFSIAGPDRIKVRHTSEASYVMNDYLLGRSLSDVALGVDGEAYEINVTVMGNALRMNANSLSGDLIFFRVD